MKWQDHHITVLKKKARGLLMAFFLLSAIADAGAQTPTRADKIKAVFLYNFSQFVDWPEEAVSGRTFVIGILGTDPFGDFIDQVVKAEKINGLPITVVRFRNLNEVSNCQILYLNDPDPVGSVKALNTKYMLTVSSAENFAREGGMVRFLIVNNKIRLQINLPAARAAGLSISSKLLRVSDVIE